ncbi:MAG: ankyrin repeat domain-containing protein [Phycisphaerales bacterium]|nr:ankyrin repeat domain-containing protein [Phycisphaerales bacterium]
MHLSLSIVGSAVILAGGLLAPVTNAQDTPNPPAAVQQEKQQDKPQPPPPGRLTPSANPINVPPSGIQGGATQPAAGDVLLEQVIVSEPESIQLGTFSTTETEEGTIVLRNTGSEPVTIRSAKASCGCTTADFQRNTVLGPNETTEVTIRMRGGPTARKLKKTVTFTIDGYPQLKVPVEGESISYVKMTPDKIGIDANPDGKLVLESIDGQPFKITRTLPNVLAAIPAESQPRHELAVDWDKWWRSAENAKLTFYIEGHPRCNQYFTVINLNREQRAEIQRRIREKREKNNKANPKKPSTTNTTVQARESDPPTLVRQGRVKELGERLKAGKVEVDNRDSQGMTLLGLAAKNGNVEIMQVLLEAGASVDATDRVQRTPLMHAGTSKNPAAVMMLIEADADVNARDLVIGGPLAWSAGFGNAECVQILVDEGAELETLGAATGYTPLIWASGFGDYNSIPILLEAGANIEVRDGVDAATPLMHASRTGKIEGMQHLIKGGANVNIKDRNGKTPLMVAAEHSSGTVEKIKLLLDNGAQIDVVDSSGKTALDHARYRGDGNAAAVVAFLEEKMPAKAAGDKK